MSLMRPVANAGLGALSLLGSGSVIRGGTGSAVLVVLFSAQQVALDTKIGQVFQWCVIDGAKESNA